MVVQAAANGLGMGPAPDHMRRAEADELATRIGKFWRRAKLNLLDLCLAYLGLRRAGETEGSDNCGSRDAKQHDGPMATFESLDLAAPAGRNVDGGGSRSDHRRAVVGEGADAWQASIRRTGDRGSSQHEG